LEKDAPSQISLVVTGKVRGLADEGLVGLLIRLGRDADTVIEKKSSETRRGSPIRV
jgi:hypothetical protein